MTSSNRIKTEIVRGTERYAGAPARDLGLGISLESEKRELIEGDRTVVLNLTERFNRERQDSTIYRLYGKCFLVFENSYVGFANTSNATFYSTLLDTLYYTDSDGGLVNGQVNNDPLVFSGYLPFNYFNILEEEQDSDNMIQSANWHIQVSYVSGHTNDKNLVWTYENPSDAGAKPPLIWQTAEGIPFTYEHVQSDGKNLIQCTCPVEHGLNIGETIVLGNVVANGTNIFTSTNQSGVVNNQTLFTVYSLGDGELDSDKFIFNFVDIGFTVLATRAAVFRRIIDIGNREETESVYYIHEHTILTENSRTSTLGMVEPEIVVNRCAFEKEIFKRQQRYFRDDMTPPPGSDARVGTKTAYPAYLYSFIKDIDVSLYKDNLHRPISELYVTITKNPLEPTNGGMLWTYPTPSWDWNYHEDYLDVWFSDWAFPSTNNTVNVDNSLGYTKIYPEEAPTGIDHGLDVGEKTPGAFVEYNKSELKERIISECRHQIASNPLAFVHEVILDGEIQGDTQGFGLPTASWPYSATDPLGIPHDESIWQNIPIEINAAGNYGASLDFFYNLKGYRYKPHNKVQIRAYSTYIEDGDPRQVVNVPKYSTYFSSSKTWRWRDLLDIGYIETDSNGVDYSFLNNAHYPMTQINLKLRRQVASDIDYVPLSAIQPIISDDCQ